MITLTVEDGTKVTGANSYVTLAYARQFAESVGLTLPVADEALKAVLLAAMTYIEGQESRYQGHRSFDDQPLSWPRLFVTGVAGDEIPLKLQNAQVTAAALINSGTDLFPTVEGQFVTKEKVGPIETDYSDEYLATLTGRTEFSSIEVFLNPYFVQNSGYRLPTFGF